MKFVEDSLGAIAEDYSQCEYITDISLARGCKIKKLKELQGDSFWSIFFVIQNIARRSKFYRRQSRMFKFSAARLQLASIQPVSALVRSKEKASPAIRQWQREINESTSNIILMSLKIVMLFVVFILFLSLCVRKINQMRLVEFLSKK